MECIDIFDGELQGPYGKGGAAPQPAVNPRISFSNGFAVDAGVCPSVKYERPSASSSSDFEFSVGSYSMMAADELFSKGRLLPLRPHCAAAQTPRTTLRDELLAGEEDDGLAFSPPPSRALMTKVPLKWKTLMGLRKANSEAKKHDKQQQQQQQEGEEEEMAKAQDHI